MPKRPISRARATGRETVFIVDDNPLVRKTLLCILEKSGYAAKAFASAEEFLQHGHSGVPGCLLLDVAMPSQSGLELQENLIQEDNPLPIVFLTGHGTIPMTVQAMKAGAVDFLCKPFKKKPLIAAIEEALNKSRREWAGRLEASGIKKLISALTKREHEVLCRVLTGQLNKQIALQLGVTEQTIKVHRGRAMRKMQVHSVAELAALMQRVDFGEFVEQDA